MPPEYQDRAVETTTGLFPSRKKLTMLSEPSPALAARTPGPVHLVTNRPV
jgi:hypothetical protein